MYPAIDRWFTPKEVEAATRGFTAVLHTGADTTYRARFAGGLHFTGGLHLLGRHGGRSLQTSCVHNAQIVWDTVEYT
jgi:hypothetical protein